MRFDAAAFLTSLFAPNPDDLPEDLPGDWHVRWDERAATLERDECLHREHAEHRALLDTVELMKTGW